MNIESKAIVFTLMFCGIICAELSARQDKIEFEHISMEDGLPNPRVVSILQDRNGFMWFGTLDGLTRYDGYNFKFFRNDPNDSASISGRQIYALQEDQEGNLWIGTAFGGLNKYNPVTNTFRSYSPEPDTPGKIGRKWIWVICEDRQGVLWVGSGWIGLGLQRFDKDLNRLIRVRDDLSPQGAIQKVRAIYEDHQGTLWIGGNSGLFSLDSTRQNFKQFHHEPGNSQSGPHKSVRGIYEDRKKNLWITTSRGLSKFDPFNDSFKTYRVLPDNEYNPINHFRKLVQNNSGALWISTPEGLALFNPVAETFTTYRHNPLDPASLSSNDVVPLCISADNILWAGSLQYGINKYDPHKRKFKHVKKDPNNPNRLNGKYISSFCEDQHGNLWVASNEGLNMFDPVNNRFEHFQNEPGNPNSLSDNFITEIREGRHGNLWIATLNGLNRFNPLKKTFQRYYHDPANPNSLAHNRIDAVYEDLQGIVWVGSRMAGPEGGLTKFDPQAGTYSRYQHQPDDPKSLSQNQITWICEDPADNGKILWVGTNPGGLNKLDRETNQFTRYMHVPGDPNSLSEDVIMSITFARNGIMWVSTLGGGLNKFDRDTETFKIYRTIDGLFSDNIYGALEDDAGNLWISGDKGISKFNPHTETFKNFDIKDGLQHYDFNSGAIFKSPRTGKMYFGGINGFNVFHPDNVKDNPYNPPIVFTDFKIFNASVPITRDNAVGATGPVAPTLPQSITETKDITLSYRENVFAFEFAALHYSAPEKNQYAHKMEGFDRDWVYTGNKREATYTNLEPGTYIFRVKGSNADGVWNEEGASIKLTITPPWWKTTWAYLLYIGLALAAVFGFISFRTDQLKQRSRELEQTVAERTREIRQQTEELETFDGIVRTINRETVLEEVLYVLLEQGMKLFPQAEKASFLLRDSEDEFFRFAIVIGYDEELLENIALTETEVLHRYTNRSEKIERRAYIVREFEKTGSEDKFATVPQPKSILAMAVVLSEKLEGFFILDNFSDVNAFNNSDVEKLSRFRQHAVSAIAKAKTLHKLQQKNAEILRTQEQLVVQEKLASLGQLTAGIAHEIKNPLNFVNNFAELSEDLVQDLLEELENQKDSIDKDFANFLQEILDDLAHNASKINHHGKRADGIVQGMLAHSRGKSGEFQEIDINELLEEYVNLAYHGMRARNSEFNVTIEKEYDDSIGNIAVEPQDLSRVFLNLLNNAFDAVDAKFDGEKGMSPTVIVSTKKHANQIEIRIRDNGTGIPENIRKQIFNPFFTTKPTGQGNTGLGLSISHDIITKGHRGELSVETETGKYTEFIIRLPITK